MMDLFKGTYKGRKVFITGHTGFKGSWLSLWLTKLGANVIGYSLDIPSEPSHFSSLKLPFTHIKADIRDLKRLKREINKHKPDIVFHLAAQALVRESYKDPVKTLETNIMGSAYLLEACRGVSSIKSVVIVTSDKCYENNELNRGYVEGDPMGGYDPYSVSKGCVELLVNAYRKSFFSLDTYGINHNTLIATARAGNVIGGGDWAMDRIVPDIVRATVEGKPVLLRNPRSTRPWQHVLEPLSGYLQLAANLYIGKKEFSGAWNFGPNKSSKTTVEMVVKTFNKYWKDVQYLIEASTKNPHEAKLLSLNSKKAKVYLGWKQVWSTEETIEKTVRWYKQYYKKNKLLSEADIKKYVVSAKKNNLSWTN